jgi:hypothetical protein
MEVAEIPEQSAIASRIRVDMNRIETCGAISALRSVSWRKSDRSR